jgi:hypothetical protein
MNGRLRKLGLGAVLVGGTVLFGIGFAGAQSPSDDAPAPKSTHPDGTSSTYQGDGGAGCGDHGAAEVSSIDL